MQINGAIVISGSPGLKDVKARKIRAAKDDSRAQSLLSFGLRAFVNTWYHGDLWQRYSLGQFFSEYLGDVRLL